MCDEGFLQSGELRKGYVKPLGQAWKQVTYADVDGRAIFEGCIILGDTEAVEAAAKVLEQQIQSVPDLLTKPDIGTLGIVIKGKQYRWPNATIPYVIDPALPNRQRIADAIAHWESKTSIRFKQRTDEDDYIFIRRVTGGCASHVGRQGGKQEMILADSCSVGNIIHEFGHAAGLWHEQSRADRDNFVEILFSNVDPGQRHNFEQHIHDGIDVADYDYGSIMHYPAVAFSIDGAATIQPRAPLKPGVVMGQRAALSAGDIAAIAKIYPKTAACNA